MEIIIAETAGFCFGVKRALEMVEAALKDQTTPIYSLGPLIHNPQVVEALEHDGLQRVEDIRTINEGRVVIRSHGVGPSIYQMADQKGLSVIDATCPFVKNVHQLAILLKEQGYQVIIFGEQEHAEVRGVIDSVAGAALVMNNTTDIQPQKIAAKVGIISQTTQDVSNFRRFVAEIVPLAKEVRVYNTICVATTQRQAEAASLSAKVDRMIVVGGKNSANTLRLAEICQNNRTATFTVETPEELNPKWFEGAERVGVTAGASTPERQILAVIDKIKTIGGNQS